MPICTKCGQENPEVARFCLACGSPLAPPEPVLEERKSVTVLFCDIVGSTAAAEHLDPEDVRARLAPYYERVRDELERFGGTVEKFIGDAVVALFGAPVAHEDDPERAVRAALAVRDAVSRLNEEDTWLDLNIRVGVNTGEALVVVGVRPADGEGMASGDVMNTAARLQSAAPVNGIVVGELTFRATRGVIDYREAEPIAAKGKSEPVRLWEFLGVRETGVPTAGHGVALVGRNAQVEELRILWLEACEGRRSVAIVVGAPGVGKTRLLRELAAAAAGGAQVFVGRCLSYGEGITYWPITEIVKSAAGILQSDEPSGASAKLGSLLERLPTGDADELRTIAAAVSNLLGIPTTPRGTYAAAQISQAELHWGIRRFFEELAAIRPLLLLIEDLHWAEPTLLDLLLSVAAEGEAAAMLLLGSGRPELLDTSHPLVAGAGHRRVLELEALDDDDSKALLAQLVGDRELPDALVEKVLRNAEGNPLFIEEMVATVQETSNVDLLALPVPDTVQALIDSRLDALAVSDKSAAQTASVVGHLFWRGAVAELAESTGGIEASLAELARRDFIRLHEESTVAGEQEYAFKHILIRDVAYARLPKARRAQLHVRFCDWLDTLAAGDDEFVEITAYHLEQSCRLARELAHSPIPPPIDAAVDALRRASEKATRRESFREGDRFLVRATELLDEERPETLLELRVQRGRTTLATLGEITSAMEQLLIAAEQAPALGRLDLRCSALITAASIDMRLGRPGEARPRLLEADALAAQLGDRTLQVRSGYGLSALYSDFDGEFEAAEEKLGHAISVAEEIADRTLVVEGQLRMGFLRFNAGDLGGAEASLGRCLAFAAELGSRRDEARAMFLLGLTKYYRGDLAEAERLALQTHDSLERTGETFFQIQNYVSLGILALARENPEAAEAYLREAVPLALEEGRRIIEVYRFLVEALVQQGRAEEAAQLAEFAGRNLPEDDVYSQATVRLAEALAATGQGHAKQAMTSYEEAVRLYDGLHLPIEGGQTRVAFARALRAFGDGAAARSRLHDARGIFDGIGATGVVAAIDRELAQTMNGPVVPTPTR